MSYTFINVERCENILEITLNRPEKRNALTFEMIAELISAFKEATESDAAAIILASTGPAFCAGHDYSDMLSRDLGGMRQLMHTCSQLMQLIHQVPQPVIAGVQGMAIGGGCQLALTCDMVVASQQAMFRTPGGAGGWFCFTPMVAVARAVGRKRALEMLMCGDPIPAELASEWGMINRVVPAENLAAETREMARRASQGSRLMMGLGKGSYYAQIDLDEAQAYKYAAELMASTGTMPDARERMNAFVQKRRPDPIPVTD
jgi:enoyl-CoA hydratase/carnithine racemase